jgi:hypothetical protein
LAIPDPSLFSVQVNGNFSGIASFSVSGSNVVLSLSSSVHPGDTVSVSYTDPTSGNDASAIQDTAGNDVTSFSGYAVSNNTPSTLLSVINVYAEKVTASDNHQSAVFVPGDQIVTYVELNGSVTVTGAPRLAHMIGETSGSTHTVYAAYDASLSSSSRLALHYHL